MQIEKEQFPEEVEKLLLAAYPYWLRRFCSYPLRTALTLSIAFISIQIAIVAWNGNLYTSGDILGMLNDVTAWSNTVLFAIFILYYLWIPRHLKYTFKMLIGNGIFREAELSISTNIVENFHSRRTQALQYFVAILFYVPIMIAILPIASNKIIWINAHANIIIYQAIAQFVFMLIMSGEMLTYFLIQDLTHDIFLNNPVIVYPLHHDKAGGFNALGLYAFKFVIVALALGLQLALFFTVSLLDNRGFAVYVMGLFLVVYIFAVPILFYLPIREAHDVMLDFRNKLLNDLSLNYSKVQNSLNLSSEDANKELADTVEKLNQLRGLQEHILRYPVWPFDFRTGIGVAVNSVLPILAALVGLAFDLIS